jgi:hypothetical protein
MRNSASAVLAVAAVAALGAGLLFSLVGCVQQPRAILPTSSPSVAPVFKSDADALAAAKKTYDGYLAITDTVGKEGGMGSGRIATWVTTTWFPAESKSWSTFALTGNRFEGSTTYDSFDLQQRSQNSNGVVDIYVYVCADIVKTRLLDSSGRDITAAGRANVFPLVVEFKGTAAHPREVLLAGSEPWSGKTFCS